ncbi:MAG: TrpB-like pyridoxal phosphate-dependent enzyme [Acidobacteriota bacterium]|nr:TrpB-like pyridoxal phosphate-dependent enzyme [Acidobacteriota bacterium]MDW3229174.1 TrpB-like pyridoxal phosphate-dependent enzyme [Acidobacteriota bacterium]MDY0232175.1 TrpB-like pyridoxal phosphate-dependent enzyme [Candidatus Saccharicenans sp.]
MLRYATRNSHHLPDHFYNIKADLPELPPPPLNPATRQPLKPEDLEIIFSRSFIDQEISLDRNIPIPAEVLEAYSIYRPTPLIYASRLKKYLDTPANIFYKFEGVSPTGSHKTNTALMQAFLANQDGVSALTTETGAGQWGAALAYAGSIFGIKVKVFMVRASFRQKPGRRIMIQLFGGEVLESPGPATESGKRFYQQDPEHPGSLGMAISEAVEVAAMNPEIKYTLGSVLDAVLMHQTVIGLEADSQAQELGFTPDLVVGCVGGGSNFAGLSFPFIRKNLTEKTGIKFLAVEPEVCPSITRGQLGYDHGDSVGLTPLLFMYSLGKDFIPPPIHAGGLRYHGMAPLVSHLVRLGIVEARAYPQEKVFQAAELFLKTEGILPAPESAHAIAAVVDEALVAKKSGKPLNILFNLSGHGFLDISAYEINRSGLSQH